MRSYRAARDAGPSSEYYCHHAARSDERARQRPGYEIGPIVRTDVQGSIVAAIPFERVKNGLCWAALLAVILLPVWIFYPGIIHSETRVFLVNYLRDASWLAKVFDPSKNDWGWYQARELSYVFDLADAYVVDATIKVGVPLFIPLSSLIGVGAFILIQLTIGRRLVP